MGIFKSNNPTVSEMATIVDKMEKAIADCKQTIVNKKENIRKRAIEKVSEHIDEIADSIIKNMNSMESITVWSEAYYATELFEIDKQEVYEFISTLRYNDNNIFADYLIANKLTMGRDLHTGTKIRFAYGEHTNFGNGWDEICGLTAY